MWGLELAGPFVTLVVMPSRLVDPDRERGDEGRGTTEGADSTVDGGRDTGGVPYVDSTCGRRVCGEENDLRNGASLLDGASSSGFGVGMNETPVSGGSPMLSGVDNAAVLGGIVAVGGV